MLVHKLIEKGIDLFILITDEMNYNYKSYEYMAHADYNSFKLVFSFEDWTNIINDGKQHLCTSAEYINADDGVLVKWTNEDFDKLLDEIKEWNTSHKIQS